MRQLVTLLLLGTLTSFVHGQNGNQVLLSEGGTTVYLFNNPSVGGPTGAPLLTGDLEYTGLPQNRVRTASGLTTIVSIEDVFLAQQNWSAGPPTFYDIGLGTSSAVSGAPFDPLVPDFFTTGQLQFLLSLGTSGLPHPCVVQPTSTCTASTACPPVLSGYVVDVSLGTPLQVPTSAADTAGISYTQFLPGGMLLSSSVGPGGCLTSTWVFQGRWSQTERQADYLNVAGTSWSDGFQIGSTIPALATGPVSNGLGGMLEVNLGFSTATVAARVADPMSGLAPVLGGASLGLESASGAATVSAVVEADLSLAGAACFPAVSNGTLASPLSVFGADVLLVQNGTFSATLAAWAATGPLVPLDVTGDGIPDKTRAESPPLSVPAGLVGRVHLQAYLLTAVGPPQLTETSVFALDLR